MTSTQQQYTTGGRYGVYVPYLLILADFVVLNLLLYFICYFNDVDNYKLIKTLIVIANASYLPVASMSLTLRRARAVRMETLVVKSIHMTLLYAIIFSAVTFFLDIDQLTWRFYTEFFIALFIVLPLSWVVTRMAVKRFRRLGHNFVSVVVIGNDDNAVRLVEELQRDPGFGYKILGFFDVSRPEKYRAGKYLGDITTDMPNFLAHNHVDEIYYTLDGNNEDNFRAVMRLADDTMTKFFYVPRITRIAARTFKLGQVGSLPILVAHNNPLDNPINRVLKRGFDLAFSSIALLLSPIVVIPVAIAIKTSSPGPIFFKQKRTGYRGADFTCWKFRTMRVNADSDKVQATAHDPRKTRVGDFLRKSSIDELPQFLNVFLGDMSVVGPRPHMVKHTEDYSRLIDRYMLRHVIKPGVTGWAQVSGYRGATSELWQMEGRVEKDVWYIENWSLLLDLKIIIRTVTNALHGEENAY